MEQNKNSIEYKKIMLFWDNTTKTKLLALKYKYKLSISTILDILINSDVYTGESMCKEKLFKNKSETYRTSVKPRINNKAITMKERNIAINNFAYMYAHKEYAIYAEKVMEKMAIKEEFKEETKNKIITTYLNTVQKELESRIDSFYLYNETTRNQIRFIKDNPEYVKKLSRGK